MKWIAYIFECLLDAICAVGGGGTTSEYMSTMGRERNSTDALVGAISLIVVVLLIVCFTLLIRHWRKKHRAAPEYHGYMAQKEQGKQCAEKSETTKDECTTNE